MTRVKINVSLTRDVYDALNKFADDAKRVVSQRAEVCIAQALIDNGYYKLPEIPVHLLEKWEQFKNQQESEQ